MVEIVVYMLYVSVSDSSEHEIPGLALKRTRSYFHAFFPVFAFFFSWWKKPEAKVAEMKMHKILIQRKTRNLPKKDRVFMF